MNHKIIAIGTSKGIRIPKYLLDKYGLEKEADIEDTGSGILIKPITQCRSGWENAFKKVAEKGTEYVIDTPPSEWDKNEWEW